MNPGLEASPAPADPAQAPSDAPVLASDRRSSSRSNRDPRALLDEVIAELQQRPGAPDVTLVDRAFELATRAHEGQRRRSGEPYLIHPVRVARTIARMGLGACSVAASSFMRSPCPCNHEASAAIRVSTRVSEDCRRVLTSASMRLEVARAVSAISAAVCCSESARAWC